MLKNLTNKQIVLIIFVVAIAIYSYNINVTAKFADYATFDFLIFNSIKQYK